MSMVREIEWCYFESLFKGRTDAIGLNKGGVERREVTSEDYRKHLAGEEAVGIFPLQDDGTVMFAAIDLDEPNFELAQDLQTLLPCEAHIEQSRSGNAHVWVFFDVPCPAWAIRAVMFGALESVGRPEVEIFPKQDRLKEGMLGNYINLPFFGNSRQFVKVNFDGSIEPAFDTNCDALTHAIAKPTKPDKIVRRAEAMGALPPELRPAALGEFGDRANLHICAEHIIKNKDDNPISSGGRNVVMFNLSRQLLNWRELDDDEAWELVQEVNAAALPPLPVQELRRQFESARSGRYTSTGCDDPLMAPYIHPDCPIVNR